MEDHGTRRWIWLGGGLATVGAIYVLRGVLFPLMLAFVIAYALDPVVDWLERKRVPRALGAALVMLLLVSFVTLVIAVAAPLFIEELRDASRDLPSQLEALQKQLEPWAYQRFKIKLPHSTADWLKWSKELTERMQGQPSGGLSFVSQAVFGTLGYVAALVSALIIPVFALYLLIDFDSIVARAAKLVPRRWSQPVGETCAEIHTMLGGYLRGQLTANLVLSVLYAAGLQWVDIRLALPIGVLTGMLAFVPYVGFSLGLVLAAAMALLDAQHPSRVLGVLGVMLGVQLLDGMVITPRIVGRSVGLSPLEVLLALATAGTLFGFVGVLFAVPLGAITKIVVRRLVAAYVGSSFYSQAPGSKSN